MVTCSEKCIVLFICIGKIPLNASREIRFSLCDGRNMLALLPQRNEEPMPTCSFIDTPFFILEWESSGSCIRCKMPCEED